MTETLQLDLNDYFVIKGLEVNYNHALSKSSKPLPFKQVIAAKFSNGSYYLGFQTKPKDGYTQWFIFTDILVNFVDSDQLDKENHVYTSRHHTEYFTSYKAKLEKFPHSRICRCVNRDKFEYKFPNVVGGMMAF